MKVSQRKIQNKPEQIRSDKKLINRNSLLIDLFENDHIRTVYHMFLATFVAFFINISLRDYLENGEINLGLGRILYSFEKVHLALLAWIGFFIATCFCHPIFKIWARFRDFSPLKGDKIIKEWDLFWIVILLCYYVISFRIGAVFCTVFNLPPASSAIVLMEQVRFLMKLHAFVRVNAEKVLKFKPHSEEPMQISPFNKFLYFLFAPTLIFKDEYPRTDKIRWNFIFFRSLEVLGAIFYISFIIERFLHPTIRDFCNRKFKIFEIVVILFENSISGILMLLPSFFLVLHSWQNIFAELTRFGDRLFYKDWWTCTSHSGYFRTWNVVVHNWLYFYIYQDVHDILAPKRKTLAKFAVFLVSLLVHEYVATYMFGFFLPLIFTLFFIGILQNFLIEPPKTPLYNIIFLYTLALGAGFIVTVYGLEYYARFKVNASGKWDFYLPRLIKCIDFN